MKNLLAIIILFSMPFCFSQVKERKLIWEENFNDNVLNEKNWNFEIGDGCPNLCGWGNNERQVYTRNNHKLKNGNLIISAVKENANYTSTRITTYGKQEFKYGRIEARAQIPIGNGIWPAFWMLGSNIKEVGWPMCGEIDILEYIGKEPNTVFTSLHTKDSFGNTINTKKSIIPEIENGFHVYAIDWNKDKIEFFVDDVSVYVFNPSVKNEHTWPFDKKFYIVVNVAIGGNFGGPEVDDTIFPQQFVLDYIKVYQ